jgi:hypothetical protein
LKTANIRSVGAVLNTPPRPYIRFYGISLVNGNEVAVFTGNVDEHENGSMGMGGNENAAPSQRKNSQTLLKSKSH